MRLRGSGCLLVAGILLAGTATAYADGVADESGQSSEQSNWYVQFGAAYVDFISKGKVDIAGQRIAGASAAASDNITFAAGLGYFVTPEVSLFALAGVPPETKVKGKGDLAGLGTLGKATYGPAMVAVNYHFKDWGRFQPFIGPGFTYTPVFHSKDGVLKKLQVDDTVGPILRIGFELMITKNIGMFADVNKVFYITKARATYNDIPVSAKVDLNPYIMHTGITYHF